MGRDLKIEQLKEAKPLRRGQVSIAISHPDVACYWHPKKNRGFGPEDFSYGSTVKSWWFCDKSKDHVYQTEIKIRVKGIKESSNGCPFCAGLRPSRTNWLAAYPEVAAEFHSTKNGSLDPKKIVAASPKLRYWKCFACNNVFQQSPWARTRNGAGCPKCNRGERLDLSKHPQAMQMFDKRKNGNINPRSMDSHAKVWWKCPAASDHAFKAGFYKSHGPKPECPFCAGHKASSTNNLGMNERLAKEFHLTKNGNLTVKDLTLGSHTRIWWKCPKGPDHEWQQFVYMRKRGRNCPFCSGFRLSKTNVLAANPKLAKEFHPTKNGNLTPDSILATWHKKVFWKCSVCKLEWEAKPYQRMTEGMGCPECKKVNTGRGRLSTRQKEKAAKLLKTGMPVAKIAQLIGVHFMTIYRIRDAVAAGTLKIRP